MTVTLEAARRLGPAFAFGLAVALGSACTPKDDPRDHAPARALEPARTEPMPDPEPMPNPDPAATAATTLNLEIDGLARACAGDELRERLAALSPAQLEGLTHAEGASARLWAIWEAARSFDADGRVVPASVDAIAEAIESALGQGPPSWWLDQLRAGKQAPDSADGPPYYDVGVGESSDRRGAWELGPGKIHVRPGSMMLGAEGDDLVYDLSMGRVVLGPLPEPHTMVEHARARAGSTIYVATFSQGSGGFRFPLRAIGSDSQELWQELWTAEVCGPDRQVLGGLGHLTVEIVVLEAEAPANAQPGVMRPPEPIAGIAVFTAESHGVALDVFDAQTGARTLAWSSDLWSRR